MVGGLIIRDLLKDFGLKAKVVLLALAASYFNLLAVSSASYLATSTAKFVFIKLCSLLKASASFLAISTA